MKRLTTIALALAILFSIVASSALAADGNVDGSGGGMGQGSSTSYWNGGDDGVRVTVITKEGRPVSTPVDYSNINTGSVQAHFGKVSKISYTTGNGLSPSPEKYISQKPARAIPRIISTSAYKASIEQIKAYWCIKETAEMISNDTGIEYESLVSGDYKLLLEPIAYFRFNSVFFAMTATEAALYNKLANGGLRAKMVSLTSKNLPLSMYLQVPDIGFPAYAGSKSTPQLDDTIISSLGLGIVSFKLEVEDEAPPTANYTYRTDTDVITSITLSNNGSEDVSPDKGCSVEFEILGKTYRKSFICPSGGKQIVWVKWHTPSTPQLVNVRVRGVGFSMSTTISANIVELVEYTPPDPQYKDTNSRFKLTRTPDYGSNTTATWSQWFATWVPPVMPKDTGYWQFHQETYTVSLDAELELSPDTRVQTAKKRGRDWEMKSGYGVNADCKTGVYTTGKPSFDTDYTQAQTEMASFSEFGFVTYNRILEPEDKGRVVTNWHFKENINSYYGNKVHFTPLWYPDGTDYVVALSVYDVWTPVGMLYTTVSDSVAIEGNVYDDWYIRLTE